LPIAYRAAQADVRKADLATGVPVQEPEADSAAPKPEPVPAVPPAKKPAIAPVKETKPVAPVPKPEVPAKMGELRLDNRLLMPLAPPGLAHEPAAAKKPAPVVTERHTPDDDWRRAQQLIREGHPEQAEAVLRRAMQSQPGLVAPRQALLGILLSAKRHAEAADVLREGLVHSPEQTGWVMTLARLQAEKNDYPAAWETLSRSTAIAQQNADYQAFCGTVLQRLNRSSEAAGYYRNALKLKPREARWWVGYGIALEAEGKIAEARESYTRARSIGDMPPEVSAFVEQKLR
jgi:MSHA biogenesis protein MshN